MLASFGERISSGESPERTLAQRRPRNFEILTSEVQKSDRVIRYSKVRLRTLIWRHTSALLL